MKNKGSFLAGMVTMLLIVALAVPAMASSGFVTKDLYYNNITVTLDGKPLVLQGDREPFVINGTTFLPVRAISEALGLDVDWDGASSTVILTTPKEDRQTAAYKALYDWTAAHENIENGHAEMDGSTLVTVYRFSDHMELWTLYKNGGAAWLTTVNLREAGSAASTTCKFFRNGDITGTVTLEGTAIISPESFSKSSTYQFDVISGSAVGGTWTGRSSFRGIETHEEMARTMLLQGLTVVDMFMEDSGYSVADFGYAAYEE